NQGSYPRRVYAEAIKRAGIVLRPPCVNRSRLEFAPEEGAIRVGLETVVGLQDALRLAIVRERDRDGPYRDLADLRQRAAPGPEALATLIRCGALDFTGRSRPALALEARLQDRGALGASRGREPPEVVTPGEAPPTPGANAPGSPGKAPTGELFAL